MFGHSFSEAVPMRLPIAVALCLSPVLLQAQRPRVSSTDVADAAERIGGQRSHMDGSVRRIAGARLEGPAVTMRIVPDDSASGTGEGLRAIRIVEEAPAGSVIVVCGGDADHAVFGATFATLAKSRGLAGFVVDGAMRGQADLETIGVPVFSRGLSPGSAGGHYRLESVNTPVECAGTRVAPGDLIVGDADGVAVIPGALRHQVLTRAAALRAEKEAMLRLIAKHRSYTRAVEEYRRSAASRPPQSP